MLKVDTTSLIGSKTEGFFFLRNQLTGLTSPDTLTSIMHRASELYEQYSKKMTAAFNPHFTFEELVEGKLRLVIHHKQAKIGHLDLVAARDKESNSEVLQLQQDLWETVSKQKYVNLSIDKIRTKIQGMSTRMDDIVYQLLMHHISLLVRMDQQNPGTIAYDLEVTSDGVSIAAYRDQDVFSYLFTSVK